MGFLNTIGTYVSSAAGPLENLPSFIISIFAGNITGPIGVITDVLRARKNNSSVLQLAIS